MKISFKLNICSKFS